MGHPDRLHRTIQRRGYGSRTFQSLCICLCLSACLFVRLFVSLPCLNDGNSHEAENRSQRFQSNVQCRVLRGSIWPTTITRVYAKLRPVFEYRLHSRFALCSLPFFADLSRKITIVRRNCLVLHSSIEGHWSVPADGTSIEADQMLLTN